LWISSGSLAQFRSIRLPAVIPRDLGTEAAGKNKARDHEGAMAGPRRPVRYPICAIRAISDCL